MLNTEVAFAVGAVVFFLGLQQRVLRRNIPGWRKGTAATPVDAALRQVQVAGKAWAG